MGCGNTRAAACSRSCGTSTLTGTRRWSKPKFPGDCLNQADLLDFVAAALERQGIPYAVTGSHASFAYGEHRFTNDIDVVIRLTPAQLPGLLSEFPSEEFYVSEMGAAHAAAHG